MSDPTNGRPHHMLATRPYGSLETFLSNAKNTLHSAIISQQRVTIVLGDDSADADSIVSSILYAYFRSSSDPNTPLTNTSVNRHRPTYQYPPLYIPIVNSHAQHLKDQEQLSKVLKQGELTLESLITLDDLDIDPPAGLNPDNTSTLSPQNARIMLTGQHKLTGDLSPAFDACIIGHMDNTCDQDIPPVQGAGVPRISSKTATCTSLVINRNYMLWYRLTWGTGGHRRNPSNDDDDDDDDEPDLPMTREESTLRSRWDCQIAGLAAAVILLATDNLQDQEVTTRAETRALAYIEERLSSSDVPWDRNAFFESLS